MKNNHVVYLISQACISCGACWREVPEHFVSHEVDANAIVYKQPVTIEDDTMCLKAMKICPVEAISRYSLVTDAEIAKDK